MIPHIIFFHVSSCSNHIVVSCHFLFGRGDFQKINIGSAFLLMPCVYFGNHHRHISSYHQAVTACAAFSEKFTKHSLVRLTPTLCKESRYVKTREYIQSNSYKGKLKSVSTFFDMIYVSQAHPDKTPPFLRFRLPANRVDVGVVSGDVI